ncbi:MAG: hypothetical protein SH848_01655 [Saprospiraceae bacterium]|nr:hypothetical protein [Saprospiraceae bacterium]MDZ4702602.1 hypothetical protein [Saprospiraceae bacterium]
MATIVAFLLFIGVISSPEQATQELKDAHQAQFEQYSIVNDDLDGW